MGDEGKLRKLDNMIWKKSGDLERGLGVVFEYSYYWELDNGVISGNIEF